MLMKKIIMISTMLIGFYGLLSITGCEHPFPPSSDDTGYRARVPDGGRVTELTPACIGNETTVC
jgi:hypothetical protein